MVNRWLTDDIGSWLLEEGDGVWLLEEDGPMGWDPTDITLELAEDCVDATLAVVNIALSRIGESKKITDLEADIPQAIQARLHLTQDIETVLRDGQWPFATRYAELVLVEGEEGDPVNEDWTYSYRVPTDMIRARRLADESYQRRNPNPAAFRIGSDADGGLIYTNEDEGIVLEYTCRPICPCSQGDSLFRSALAWKLAHSLAPSLSKIDSKTAECWQQYLLALQLAQQAAANEETPQVAADPDWLAR